CYRPVTWGGRARTLRAGVSVGNDFVHGLGPQLQPLVDLLGGDDQRRDHPHHVAVRAAGQQQQTPAGGGLLRAHRGGGVRAPVGGGELVAQHQPPAPHVTDDRVVGGDLAQSFFEPRALLGGVVHQAFFLHHLQRGDRGGGRDRVAPVG